MNGYRDRVNASPILALDIGGTWTRTAIVTPEGDIASRRRTRTPATDSGDELIAFLIHEITEVRDSAPSPASAVGVSVTGPINPRTGVMYRPPNTGRGFHGLPLSERISASTGLPVVADRDTNAALVAEQRYGAGRRCFDLVYMTVSTGVGGAVMLDGRLIRGADGVAGELGHVSVNPDGPRCGCGRDGCLEAIASGPALTAAAKHLGARDGQATEPTGEQIALAAARGDELALAILERARDAIVSASVDMVNLFNPQRLILGGAVVAAHPTWVTAAQTAVRERALAPAAERALVVGAELGDDAGLLGASLMAWQDGEWR
jgi:glucokinase